MTRRTRQETADLLRHRMSEGDSLAAAAAAEGLSYRYALNLSGEFLLDPRACYWEGLCRQLSPAGRRALGEWLAARGAVSLAIFASRFERPTTSIEDIARVSGMSRSIIKRHQRAIETKIRDLAEESPHAR